MTDEEIHAGPADVGAVFAASFSGNWPAPYLSADDLLVLSSLCLAAGRIVHTIEAYAVAPQADELVTELSRFGVHPSDLTASWSQRAIWSRNVVEEVVAEAKATGLDIRFQVWLDGPAESKSPAGKRRGI